MKFITSDYFNYKSNTLFCEEVPLEEIAAKVGTPVYVYSKKYFVDRYEEFHNALSSIDHRIFYAAKANYNISVIKLFNELGAGIDVNSEGEMLRALKAGVNPKDLIFSGVGKTEREIKLALEQNLFLLKAESMQEIQSISRIASSLKKTAHIAIRVNPNVDPNTHPYISTGLAENKFGIDETEAFNIFSKAAKLPNIVISGIDMHIGSQITKIEPYAEAIKKLLALEQKLKGANIHIEHIDLGGGIGISYNDENSFSYKEFADSILPLLQNSNLNIFVEPGRSLTANGGCLVTKTLYTKTNLNKNFVIVDAAMTDMLRPSIYSAYHHIQPVNQSEREDYVADIVGPVCESGDFLGKKREIQVCYQGDLLALMSAGAYGIVMSSNYNARRRPPEVLVDNDKYMIIRKRETFEQLIENEMID